MAVIGYGNIGKACEAALLSAPDMELARIYHHSGVPDALQADVALLCTPTREVPKYAEKMLRQGICTVDSFDIHAEEVNKGLAAAEPFDVQMEYKL